MARSVRFAALPLSAACKGFTPPRPPRYSTRMSRSRVLRIAVLLVIAIGYLACVQATVHRTATTPIPPREPRCVFEVVSTHPGPGYLEVAQISVDGPGDQVAGYYHNPREFANEVREKVCAAGGDVLMTEINGFGSIIHAIVFHRVAAPEPPPAASSPAIDPNAPPYAGLCEPICSPGFACIQGTCIPQCNPACTGSDVCGNDRLCHAR